MAALKNPNWTTDEVILALDLYFREPDAVGRDDNESVIELSELLNRLPIHHPKNRLTTFRNPNGVGLKLANLRALDPEMPKGGSGNASDLDRRMMTRYKDSKHALAALAQTIRLNADSFEFGGGSEWGEDFEAEEGAVLTRVHQQRERDRALVGKKKKAVLGKYGKLACEVCDFNFSKAYGEHGQGFAECHHKTPVSKLRPGQKTHLSELAIVCANCHRMLHRGKSWKTLNELKKILQ